MLKGLIIRGCCSLGLLLGRGAGVKAVCLEECVWPMSGVCFIGVTMCGRNGLS